MKNVMHPKPILPHADAPVGVIRKAVTGDVVAIQHLVNGFAERGLMLHRSLSELYENLRDFHVVVENETVVGCAALHVTWKDLAELKSLAVAENCQGRGYGRSLILACMQEAGDLGVARVFALTYVPHLFEKMGWARQDKASLPRKVWTECIHCPKFPDCGEIAVIYEVPGSGG
ncbi:MAG: N-acetyltransferase [Chthonomonadales bacterium]